MNKSSLDWKRNAKVRSENTAARLHLPESTPADKTATPTNRIGHKLSRRDKPQITERSPSLSAITKDLKAPEGSLGSRTCQTSEILVSLGKFPAPHPPCNFPPSSVFDNVALLLGIQFNLIYPLAAPARTIMVLKKCNICDRRFKKTEHFKRHERSRQ
jgi:hypothetical protein